jgi:hypothetical protein
MPRFTVQQGKIYKAEINLGLMQSVASNEMVAERLREAGFTDVVVTGSGRTRLAQGVWPHADTAAEIPSEVANIQVVAWGIF